MSDFSGQIPGGEQPRNESIGEAQVRFASWLKMVFRFFAIELKDATLLDLSAKLIKKFPGLAKWKAPKK